MSVLAVSTLCTRQATVKCPVSSVQLNHIGGSAAPCLSLAPLSMPCLVDARYRREPLRLRLGPMQAASLCLTAIATKAVTMTTTMTSIEYCNFTVQIAVTVTYVRVPVCDPDSPQA